MKKIIIVFSIFLLSVNCYAFITDIGIDPLDQSSGAKMLSMGGAYAGASGGVDSLFNNPAGIANADGVIITWGDFEKFYINNHSLGVVLPSSFGHFGIGTVSKHYDDIDIGKGQTANYDDNIDLIGYGIGSDRLSFGLTCKSSMSQRFSIDGGIRKAVNNAATGFDAGILWKPVNYASIGLVMRDLSASDFKLGSSNESFSETTRLGVLLNVLGKDSIYSNDTYGVRAAYDAESGKAGSDQRQNSFYGAEGSFNDWLYMRIGASSVFFVDGNVSGSSVGLGIKFTELEADFTSYKDPLTQQWTSYLSLATSLDELYKLIHPSYERPSLKDMLKVDLPDEYITDNENIIISGETLRRAIVMINGAQADVDNEGKYSVIQPLLLGKNLIQIIASIGDNSKTIERKVFRNAKVTIAEEESIDKKITLEASAEQKELLLQEKKRLEDQRFKVENLVTAGVINIPSGSKFQINSFISRGEMISWLVISFGIKIPEVKGPVLKDVPQEHKYAAYIKAALDAGLIKSDPDGRFRPDDLVTEREGQVFFRAFGISK